MANLILPIPAIVAINTNNSNQIPISNTNNSYQNCNTEVPAQKFFTSEFRASKICIVHQAYCLTIFHFYFNFSNLRKLFLSIFFFFNCLYWLIDFYYWLVKKLVLPATLVENFSFLQGLIRIHHFCFNAVSFNKYNFHAI